MTPNEADELTYGIASVFPSFFKTIIKAQCDSDKNILTHPHYNILFYLAHSSIALPTSEIGEKLIVSKPQMTVLTDKLVEEGYVERVHDENDRRVIKLAITEKGKAFVQLKKDRFKKVLMEKMELLDIDEQDELKTAVKTVAKLFKKIMNGEEV